MALADSLLLKNSDAGTISDPGIPCENRAKGMDKNRKSETREKYVIRRETRCACCVLCVRAYLQPLTLYRSFQWQLRAQSNLNRLMTGSEGSLRAVARKDGSVSAADTCTKEYNKGLQQGSVFGKFSH